MSLGPSCLSITAANRGTVELRFWAGAGAKSDNRVVEVSPHCCCGGDIAVARVSQLPLPGVRGTLQSELVVELTETGVVVRRWPMPADLIVAGVKQDRILVSLAPMVGENFDGGILISTRGDVSTALVPRDVSEPQLYTCPRIPEFGDSAYLRCFEFRDLETGATRRIAYQEPCT
jgi:hypothetical protein